MAIFSQSRKKDGAEVFFVKYWAEGRQVTEKVGAVDKEALKRDRERMRVKALGVDQERRLQVENGTWVHPKERRGPSLSFDALVARFLKEYRPRSGKIDYYRERSKLWLRYLPKTKAAETISVADVDRFRRSREDNVGPSTMRKDLVTLSTLFRWAMARKLVTENPADPGKVRRPPEPKSQTTYLTETEETNLLTAAAEWLRPILRWALYSGMDREEILELTWQHVDEAAGVVWAPRGKTGIQRNIALNETLRGVLEEARRRRPEPDRRVVPLRQPEADTTVLDGGGRVFLGPTHRPVPVEMAKTAVRRAYAKAQIHVSGPFKILRHTFASRLAMKGISAAAIARVMGHSTQAITDRYMHLSPAYLAEAMGALDPPVVVTGNGTRDRAEGEKWSGRVDLNHRPPAPEAGALPGCATSRCQG